MLWLWLLARILTVTVHRLNYENIVNCTVIHSVTKRTTTCVRYWLTYTVEDFRACRHQTDNTTPLVPVGRISACKQVYDVMSSYSQTICAVQPFQPRRYFPKICEMRLISYSMKQSPWEANRFVASQEIPRISWNTNVHYRIHKCQPPVSILSQPNTVHKPTRHFLKIRFILSSHLHLGLSTGLFQSEFLTKTLYTPLSCTIQVTCPSHLIFLGFITRTN
jgi:hypothetical protein